MYLSTQAIFFFLTLLCYVDFGPAEDAAVLACSREYDKCRKSLLPYWKFKVEYYTYAL